MSANATPHTPEEVSVRHVQDYAMQLEPRFHEGVMAASDEIERVHFEFHDTKGDRVPFAWKTHGEGEQLVELENLDLRGKHLIAIGMSPAVLARLGYPDRDPINPKETFWDWAEIRCGSRRLWAHKMRLNFIDPTTPTVIYSPFPGQV